MNEATRRVPLPAVSDLIAPGKPLPFKVLDGAGRLLLNAGHRIADVKQLTALLDRGACVEFEDVEAARKQLAADGPGKVGFESAVRVRNLFDAWEDSLWELDAKLRGLVAGKVSGRDFEEQADAHIARVDRQPDVALFKAVRQDDRRFALYSVSHAMNTATVALLSARVLEWPAMQARQLVLAALTMNGSIVELQARMAEQTDAPTKRQMDEIRAHPERSASLLRQCGVTDAAWLDAVQDHHERAQGGYPRGTADIGDIARLLRAADVYAAKISPRALRAPQSPQLAARQLFQEESGGALAAALIRAVGLYPPGDFVLLKNGEAGIVVERANREQGAQVHVLRDTASRPLANALRRDTGNAEFGIAGGVADRSGWPRVLPEQVYGLLMP
jgi:HD-GYP domain-containing protein (c-di-GMP phosphodiesterase class II)